MDGNKIIRKSLICNDSYLTRGFKYVVSGVLSLRVEEFNIRLLNFVMKVIVL